MMNTNENIRKNQITLKDGKSRIANWTVESGTKLTVGDRIDLPAEVAREHPGFGKQATVSRVELDSQTGALLIDVEADGEIAGSDRPVVTLNSSLVPEDLRTAVESQIRQRLGVPVIEWEESFESAPVLRLHQFGQSKEVTLPMLQTEIRASLNQLLDSAGR